MRRYEETHPWITFSMNLSQAPVTLWVILGECNSLCRFIAGAPLLPDDRDMLYDNFLVRSSIAITGLDSNLLKEEEVRQLLRGTLSLPPSQKYIAQQNENMVRGFSRILDALHSGADGNLDIETIRDYNRYVLDRLVVPENMNPGDIRTEEAPATGDQYRPAPAEDCEFLLENLCSWLNSNTFVSSPGMSVMFGIIRAAVANLYLKWIRPFCDGNRRTSHLLEFRILIAAGLPAPAALLMSIHHARTRREYFRKLEQVSVPDGKVHSFIAYTVLGLRDGLRSLVDSIREFQEDALWNHLVYRTFGDRTSPADLRRRQLALEISRVSRPVPLQFLQKTLPAVAIAYAGKTYKTLTRDITELIHVGLIEKTQEGLRAKKQVIKAFMLLTEQHERTDHDTEGL